jgi:hypothetical protein
MGKEVGDVARHRIIIFGISLILMFSYSSLGFSDNSPVTETKAGIFLGEVKQLGNGVVWSWIKNDSKGNPSSLGVTFTETALMGLAEKKPSDTSFPTVEYELSLPKQVKVRPYNHIVVNWNPHGHVPPGIYDVPHFDFHFYTVAPGERYKIKAKGEDIAICNKKLPAKYIPAGYILPEGTQEPRMGSHWIDPNWPEFHNHPFTRSFIYGSYDGKMTFLEPMATKAFLETKPNVTEKISLPAAYEKHGFYPTAYSVKYDPARREYSVSLEGLTYR